MESRYKRLGKNSFIVFLGNAGSKIIGILMLPFYTQYLSTSGYGTYDIINTYSIILLPLVTCCIADSIFIFPKGKCTEDKTRYFTSGLSFCAFSFLLVFLISFIIFILFPNSFIGEYVWWIVGLTFSTYLLNYIQQFTRSIDKMIIYSLTGVVHVIAIAILSLLLLPSYKLTGYLAALVASSLIASFFAIFSSKSFHYINIYFFDKHFLKELLKYGIPLIPNTIMWWLVDGINRPIMMNEMGADSIGIYAIANKMPGFLSMIFVVFSNAWGISMLEEFNKPDFNSFFNRTMKVLVFLVALGSAFMITGSKLIVSVLTSSEFYEAWKYVPILVIGVIFQYISTLVGGVFMAEKKSKYFFYSSIWGAITSVLMTLLLIRPLGLFGVCIAVSLSFLCMAVVRIKFAWKYINLFDIKFYALTTIILVLQCIVYIGEYGILIDILSLIISCTVLFLLNKDNFYILKEKIISKINSKRIS